MTNRYGTCETTCRTLASLLCGMVLLTQDAAHAEDEKPLKGDFTAKVTVDAEGHVAVREITGLTGVLADEVRSQLAASRFLPALRHGLPAATTVPVDGEVVITPVENSRYAVRLSETRVAPQLNTADPPRYPATRYRTGASGTVELRLRVGPNGRILDVKAVSSSHPDYEAAVRSALKRWRFAPLPEGLPEMTVGLPVWFRVEGRDVRKPAFECASDATAARVEDQSGCLDMIEVVATAFP